MMDNLLNRFSLQGKNALLVCPQNPYAKELAMGLLAAGAKLWLAGDCPADWEIPVEGIFSYDHASAADAERLAQEVKAQIGRLDILIENGLYTNARGWEQPFDAICSQLEKTHLGMMLTVQSLGRLMAEQGNGSILLVADYGALVGYNPHNYTDCPEAEAHDFSLLKGFIAGGVVNYARQASNFLAENGCRCNAIAFGLSADCPPALGEAYIRHSQIKRLAAAEELAAAAVFLVSDAASYITGVTLPADGGYTAK